MGHAGGQFADGRQFGRLDELGLGPLQFLHPVLQVLVQPGVLDSDSRRLGHRRQQCHIRLAEITLGFVHRFDHPDHFPLDLQRDSEDRPGDETGGLVNTGVEARVFLYVGHQQGLAFPCHPAGDALAQRQSEALRFLCLWSDHSFQDQLFILFIEQQNRGGFHLEHISGFFHDRR